MDRLDEREIMIEVDSLLSSKDITGTAEWYKKLFPHLDDNYCILLEMINVYEGDMEALKKSKAYKMLKADQLKALEEVGKTWEEKKSSEESIAVSKNGEDIVTEIFDYNLSKEQE